MLRVTCIRLKVRIERMLTDEHLHKCIFRWIGKLHEAHVLSWCDPFCCIHMLLMRLRLASLCCSIMLRKGATLGSDCGGVIREHLYVLCSTCHHVSTRNTATWTHLGTWSANNPQEGHTSNTAFVFQLQRWKSCGLIQRENLCIWTRRVLDALLSDTEHQRKTSIFLWTIC